ncbi:hypothetical protein FSARC_781 [Fusarium sarcochroum]|uniref:Rhodopsin domain-containing protein n=1 Tax=Fusarium sarcochroum TaxID=1208366 RepID=A0A8H4UAJ3_9HYPO|nr:hypothetical protein FSARC_781 [Fusarium sarcochroum]
MRRFLLRKNRVNIVLMDLYRRLFLNLRYEHLIIRSYLVVFAGTYIACQVTTFSECNPFHLYWQVVPDPGSCAKAQLQLIVVGVLNIVTDTMLLVLPIPLIVSLRTAWQRKAQLCALLTLGVFIIAITVARLPINTENKDSQVNRTTWASIELLTAAIVVNAPAIYGLWNKRRQAKSESRSQGTHTRSYGQGTHISAAHTTTSDNQSDAYMMKPRHVAKGIAIWKEMANKLHVIPVSEGSRESDKGIVLGTY